MLCLICWLNGKACSWMGMENKRFFVSTKQEKKSYFVLMDRWLQLTHLAISVLSLSFSLSCYFALQSQSCLCLGTRSPLPWNSISVSRSTGLTFFWLQFFFFFWNSFVLYFFSHIFSWGKCAVKSALAQCAGTSTFPRFFLSAFLFWSRECLKVLLNHIVISWLHQNRGRLEEIFFNHRPSIPGRHADCSCACLHLGTVFTSTAQALAP